MATLIQPKDMTAAAFNQRFQVGSPCRYFPVMPEGGVTPSADGYHTTETRSPAWTLPNGQVVVKVKGRAGGVAINHLLIITNSGHWGQAVDLRDTPDRNPATRIQSMAAILFHELTESERGLPVACVTAQVGQTDRGEPVWAGLTLCIDPELQDHMLGTIAGALGESFPSGFLDGLDKVPLAEELERSLACQWLAAQGYPDLAAKIALGVHVPDYNGPDRGDQ